MDFFEFTYCCVRLICKQNTFMVSLLGNMFLPSVTPAHPCCYGNCRRAVMRPTKESNLSQEKAARRSPFMDPEEADPSTDIRTP